MFCGSYEDNEQEDTMNNSGWRFGGREHYVDEDKALPSFQLNPKSTYEELTSAIIDIDDILYDQELDNHVKVSRIRKITDQLNLDIK